MSADEVRAVAPSEWAAAVTQARDAGFGTFDHLCAVDRGYDAAQPGLDLVVRLLDTSRPGDLRAVRLTTRIAEAEPIASLTAIFPGAAWHERETAEMFGVSFTGFDDGVTDAPRPLLLPAGFEGTPAQGVRPDRSRRPARIRGEVR